MIAGTPPLSATGAAEARYGGYVSHGALIAAALLEGYEGTNYVESPDVTFYSK